MSNVFIFKVTPDGGKPFVVGVGSRDVLAWEKANPGRKADELQQVSVINNYWLAYRAAKRLGLVDCDRKVFEETHEIEGSSEKALAEFRGESTDDDGDGPDPT